MINERHTYNASGDDGSAWDCPEIDDDKEVERFIEEQRIRFRKEWFGHVEAHGIYEG